MVNTTNHNNFTLRSILEKDKLNGSNLYDWYRNLRIVLKHEGRDYVLQRPLPEKLRTNASHAVYDAWNKHYTDVENVRCLMMTAMSSDLRKQYEKVESPIEIITRLKQQFQEQTRVERFEIVKSLMGCKLLEGNPVSPHVKMMIGYIEHLERLDCPISDELAIDIILQSLPSSYDQFIKNLFKTDLKVTLTELHDMLKTAKLDIKKGSPKVLSVLRGNGFKKPSKDKGRNKTIQIVDRDGSVCSSKPKSGPSDKCSYCKEHGHLVPKCNKFLEDLKRLMMKYESSSSGICVTASISTLRYLMPIVMRMCVLLYRALTIVEEWRKEQVEMLDGNEAEDAALAVEAFNDCCLWTWFYDYVIAVM